MHVSSRRRTTCWLLASSLGACSAADDNEAVTTTAAAVTTGNRIAANRIAANRIAANRIAANRIAANRIAANGVGSVGLRAAFELDPDAARELANTPDRRELLSFLIGCALPEGQKLIARSRGTTHEFPGAIGLAPEWVERPLDRRAQRWVSACLFARVNAAGLSVQISLRGPHRALAAGADEAAAYSLEEGAFWGNIFGPDDQPLDAYACQGSDQAAGEAGDLAKRDCTEPDPDRPELTLCGFHNAGECGKFSARRPACRVRGDGSYYTGCAAPRSPPQREVITTFVKP